MFVDFPCKFQISLASVAFSVGLDVGYRLLHRPVMGDVGFEGFLLRPLGGVRPVAFGGFLHAVHVGVLSPAYPHLLEIAAPFVVVECVDGEYLLPLHGGKPQYGGYLLVPVLELGLVEQYLHVGVVDDGLLDNGRVYHVVQFLRDHPGDAVACAPS